MPTPVMRVSERSKGVIEALSDRLQVPPQRIVDDAIERYRRRLIIQSVNEDYAALRSSSIGWDHELRERARWRAIQAGRNPASIHPRSTGKGVAARADAPMGTR